MSGLRAWPTGLSTVLKQPMLVRVLGLKKSGVFLCDFVGFVTYFEVRGRVVIGGERAETTEYVGLGDNAGECWM